eukprot:3366925-Rhodomonas_salina.1
MLAAACAREFEEGVCRATEGVTCARGEGAGGAWGGSAGGVRGEDGAAMGCAVPQPAARHPH